MQTFNTFNASRHTILSLRTHGYKELQKSRNSVRKATVQGAPRGTHVAMSCCGAQAQVCRSRGNSTQNNSINPKNADINRDNEGSLSLAVSCSHFSSSSGIGNGQFITTRQFQVSIVQFGPTENLVTFVTCEGLPPVDRPDVVTQALL